MVGASTAFFSCGMKKHACVFPNWSGCCLRLTTKRRKVPLSVVKIAPTAASILSVTVTLSYVGCPLPDPMYCFGVAIVAVWRVCLLSTQGTNEGGPRGSLHRGTYPSRPHSPKALAGEDKPRNPKGLGIASTVARLRPSRRITNKPFARRQLLSNPRSGKGTPPHLRTCTR